MNLLIHIFVPPFMAVKTEKDLSPNARTLWLKASSAIEQRNFGYAVTLLQSVLKETPEFLAGRQYLRRAAIANTKGKGGFLKGISSAGLSVMKSQSLVKKDPRAAMVAAEEILEKEPLNVQANGLLRDAAVAAGMPETAVFALETMRDASPKDAKILHELARQYSAAGMPEKAVEIFNRLVEINPADMEAVKGSKDASAQQSMAQGGWNDAQSYRDVLKNKEEAVSLEQQSRITKSADMIEQQLAELSERYNENQTNLDVVRKIAGLYEQKEDFGSAVEWYQYAVSLTNSSDPGLVRKVADLSVKNVDEQIKARQDWLASVEGTELDAETAAQVETTRAELADFQQQRSGMQLEEARKRIERNPTDLNFRFELGELLVKTGQFSEAIPELQKARQSPSLGVRAMSLLGQCFESKGIYDLAIKQYEEAADRIPGMDVVKKDIVYRLALAYERKGDKEKYLAKMMEIYEIDSGYLDVAQRVESSYTS